MKLVLFNPFEKFSASKLLVFGIIAANRKLFGLCF